MGEALIARKGGGGGGGDFSLEYIESVDGGETSSALDGSATYIISLCSAYGTSSGGGVTSGALHILKEGVLTLVRLGNFYSDPVSYDASTRTIKVTSSARTSNNSRSWHDLEAMIYKVN